MARMASTVGGPVCQCVKMGWRFRGCWTMDGLALALFALLNPDLSAHASRRFHDRAGEREESGFGPGGHAARDRVRRVDVERGRRRRGPEETVVFEEGDLKIEVF